MELPPAWRFRRALRVLALDLIDGRTGGASLRVTTAAARLAYAWRGDDAAAVRRAERALARALFADIARIDQAARRRRPRRPPPRGAA